jgi:tetratricopeptide (TPR) repeat protein
LVAAGGIIALALYWQDRTLRAAQRELQDGDPQRALALVSYFLDAHPEHGGALALKARALSVTGQAAAAIELYEEVGAATVEDLHAWARAYLLLRLWSRALPLLTQVLRLEPDNADALHEITGCRVRLGLLQEALESARRLSELPDQQAKGLVLLAAIQSDLGLPEQAILTYQQVVDLVPDGKGLQIPPEELFTQYGTVLLNQGRTDAAVQRLEKGLASRPTAAAYYYLGNAHSQAGNIAAAEQAWQKSLKLDPGGVPVHEALATSALQKGDTEAALKWLRPLERLTATRFKTAYLFQRVALKQNDLAGAQRWLKTLDELRKRDQVLARVEQLMKRSPHSLWANVARAHQFASQGNWQQAADMIQELAREVPQDPFVQELAAAIGRRGPLPSLERIPIKQF